MTKNSKVSEELNKTRNQKLLIKSSTLQKSSPLQKSKEALEEAIEMT